MKIETQLLLMKNSVWQVASIPPPSPNKYEADFKLMKTKK